MLGRIDTQLLAIPSMMLDIFILIYSTACRGNHLSVNLLYSFLVDLLPRIAPDPPSDLSAPLYLRTAHPLNNLERENMKRGQLVDNLSEEFNFDLEKALRTEVEPSEEEVLEAVGGEESRGTLRESFIRFTFQLGDTDDSTIWK
jgi:hypothetical protein